MDKEFGKDLYDGLSKIVEIGSWLLDCLKLESVRNFKSWKKEEEKDRGVIIVQPFQEESQKNKKSKKSTAELKGVDNTMKKNCYHRKDGRWQYSKQREGYLYYAIANTYRELLEKIKQIKPRKIKQVKRAKTKVFTVLSYINFYFESFIKSKNPSENVLVEWDGLIRNYFSKAFPRLQLDKLTTEEVQKFINKIEKERVRERIYQKFVKILQKAYITGKIKKDITLGLEKPKRTNKEIRRPLTLEEQQALLEKVKGSNLYCFVMFSLIVGSRREETVRFSFEDVDETRGTIFIRGTKTENAPRQVYVTKAFIQFLKSNMKTNKFNISCNSATKKIGEIFEELGIDNCLHGLRHTCSANLYFLGAKDKYRQLQLGHASTTTTNDIYTNIRENIPKGELRLLYGELYPSFD